MSMRVWSGSGVLALALAFVSAGTPRSSPPAPGSPQAQSPQPGTSTLDDQTDLAITVYNSDLALILDTRNVTIAQGTSDLRFMDIAATVNPATVHFRSLTEPARVDVLEQNYEYDLLEPAKLLHKYVGRDVTLVRTKDGHEEEVKARLISDNNGPVWQIDGEIVTGMTATHIRFPELPGNLFSRPTLIWTLDNEGGARHKVEASYLARQLAWNADYVLTVARDDKSADLDGWVTVKNGSGTSFRNATLQLVAGDLNRVRSAMATLQIADGITSAKAAAPPMAQESFSDYHLYTLGRRTSINNAETKQVSMLNATAFPVIKRYVVDGQQFYYRNVQHPGSPLKDVVQVYYQLKNDEKSGLGMPMPQGTIRVYQADSRGGLQFVGEDHIDHTPKDETIDLKIGHAFDVVCERKQTDYQRISNNTWEVEYEVTLRNHKAIPITVEVNEPIGGSWTMQKASHAWSKSDAWAAKFNLAVPQDGTTVLKYRVRVTY